MRQKQDPQQSNETNRFSNQRELGVAGVISNAYTAIRQQISVTGSELSSALVKFRFGMCALAIGAGLILIGSALIPFLLVDLVLYLSDNQIPAWGAYGVVALLFVALGAGIVSYSVARFKRVEENINGAISGIGRVGEDLRSDLHSRVESVENAVKDRVEDLKNSFNIPHQIRERPWAVVGTAVVAGILMRRLLLLAGDSSDEASDHLKRIPANPKDRTGKSKIIQQLKEQIDQNKSLFVQAGVGLLVAFAKKGLDGSRDRGAERGSMAQSESLELAGLQKTRTGIKQNAASCTSSLTPLRKQSSNSAQGAARAIH